MSRQYIAEHEILHEKALQWTGNTFLRGLSTAFNSLKALTLLLL